MKRIAAVAALGVLVAGCTATNAFVHMKPDYSAVPAGQLREVADGIEGFVAAGEEEFSLDFGGGVTADTPAIRQAVRTRAIRHHLVAELLDSGFAAEERNGLITIKRSKAYKQATNSRERDRDALIVMSENDNRWSIYEGLVKANNWPPRALSAVQETFFEARVPLLAPGQPHDTLRGEE